MIKSAYVQLVYFLCIAIIGAFLYYNHFEENPIKQKYYISFKLLEFFLVVGYPILTKGILRVCGILISIFFFIRVVWQVWELEDYDSANQPYIIDILFVILAGITLIIIFISKMIVIIRKIKSYLKTKNRGSIKNKHLSI